MDTERRDFVIAEKAQRSHYQAGEGAMIHLGGQTIILTIRKIYQ